MPAGLLAQVREHSRREGISQPELLLDALSATRDELAQIFKGEAPVHDGLFVRRPARPRPVASETSATLSLRMLGENLAVIDNLVEEVGAPSRSALVVAALRRYLQK